MLRRLKLLDPDGRVSLTNLAVYIVLGAFAYCVGRNGTVNATDLGAILTALAAYRVKAEQLDRRDNADAERADRVAARDVDALRTKVSELTKDLDRALKSTTRVAPPALPAGLR
jgi:hypothetical protein